MKRERIPAWVHWTPPKDGDDLWTWQAGRCAWCGRRAGDRLVEDHCHLTGLSRGYLCRSCNSTEGWSDDPIWEPWRTGDNPAAALKQFEVYVNRYGQTPISPASALTYYSPGERRAWFREVVTQLEAGEPWPENAPWTPEAAARKAHDDGLLRAAIDRLDFFAPRPTEESA